MKLVIKPPYIKLDQALKYSGVVAYGTEAKKLILSGEVKVNDAVELRRGKKLYPGDIVSCGEQTFTVVV